jgi:hypothetical protein
MKKLKYVYKLWSSKSKTEKCILKLTNEEKLDVDVEKLLRRKNHNNPSFY